MTPSGPRRIRPAQRPDSTFHPGRHGVIHRRHWYTPGPPRAHAVLVPGLGQHVGLYDRLATWLSYDAIEVHGLDPAGHGRSEGRRAVVDTLDDLVGDVRDLLADLPQRPAAPTVLIGHDVGALAAFLATAPPWSPASPTVPLPSAARVEGRILSGAALLPLSAVTHLRRRDAGRPFQLRPGWLACGAAHRAALADDPLVRRGPLPAATLRALSDAWVDSERLVAAGGDGLPTLLLHGARDRVVPVDAARSTATLLRGARLDVLPAAGHDVLLDAPLREILDLIGDFVTTLIATETRPVAAAGA